VKTSTVVRDLDRAAAVILGGGLVVFALFHGLNTPWAFFSPIFGPFMAQRTTVDSLGTAVIADVCFALAAVVFGAARALGFWSHYSTMPILAWMTAPHATGSSGKGVEVDPAEGIEPALDEAPAAEDAGKKRRQPVREFDEPEPILTPGPSVRERLSRLWALLSERRAPTYTPIGPDHLLSGPTDRTAAPASDADAQAAGPVGRLPTTVKPPAPEAVSPTAASDVPAPFTPTTPTADPASRPAVPAYQPLTDDQHDFRSDPDFRSGGVDADQPLPDDGSADEGPSMFEGDDMTSFEDVSDDDPGGR